MNLLAMAQRVKRESGRAGESLTAVATAVGEDLDVVRWVVDAWTEIQQMPYNWAWMRDSILGNLVINASAHSPISLGATNCSHFVPVSNDYSPTVYDSTNTNAEWELEWCRYEVFRSRFIVGPQTSAAPQYWSIAPSGDFLVGPAPALSTYVLRADYVQSPIELAADLDEPAMPSDFHMMVVWKAIMHAGASDAASDVWSRASSEFDRLLDRLIDRQGEKIRNTARPLA